jgi:hypothetical protein
MHDITCGCLCRRRAVPVMDAIFPSPFFLYSFLYFILLLLSLFIQGLTRVDSVTHKYFHNDDKAGS